MFKFCQPRKLMVRSAFHAQFLHAAPLKKNANISKYKPNVVLDSSMSFLRDTEDRLPWPNSKNSGYFSSILLVEERHKAVSTSNKWVAPRRDSLAWLATNGDNSHLTNIRNSMRHSPIFMSDNMPTPETYARWCLKPVQES